MDAWLQPDLWRQNDTLMWPLWKLESFHLLGIIVYVCDPGIAIATFSCNWVATLNQKKKTKIKSKQKTKMNKIIFNRRWDKQENHREMEHKS